ncbi:MAG: flagellar biosynthetic protein FliR [Candidatus Sericytochromatia bacterium]|nr:flagellar biosynthetic protein FliR [Candidatus Sericytochromatia bacterium]
MNLAAWMQMPPQGLAVFLLVLVRASAIFLVAPVLGNANVPPRVKIGLAALLALMLSPLVAQVPIRGDTESIWGILPLVLSEMMLGLLIGFLCQLFFVAVQFAGQLVGLQMGFSMASVFDPTAGGQISVVAQFYLLLGVLIFLLLDGHHWLLIALQKSFQSVPLGSFLFDEQALSVLLKSASDLFWISMMISAPVLGVLALGEVAMAIVARILPQMNIFVASFPVKIVLGIMTMALSFPLIAGYLATETERTFGGILKFLAP